MPGGLFAVSRDWFKTLGQFDPGLKIWGAENLELSFKTWMCGGTILQTSCSRVGHVFRTQNPTVQAYSDVANNSLRVAEVWMDQYKHYFYATLGHNITGFGDVSDRVKLRKSLNCRSFAWYVDNVYPDLKDDLPVLDELYYGLIRNDKFNLCVERYTDHILNICNEVDSNQLWKMTREGVLYTDTVIIAPERRFKNAENRTLVTLQLVSQPKPVEGNTWLYNQTNKLLIHTHTGLCLEVDPSTNKTVTDTCLVGSSLQTWTLTTRRQRMDSLRYIRRLPISWE